MSVTCRAVAPPARARALVERNNRLIWGTVPSAHAVRRLGRAATDRPPIPAGPRR